MASGARDGPRRESDDDRRWIGRCRAALRNCGEPVQQFYYGAVVGGGGGCAGTRRRKQGRCGGGACAGRVRIAGDAKKMATTGNYDALVAIGCVLRGETAHYDYVCSETSRGLQLAQMDTGVPVMFCVLTCDTLEQAIDRAGLKGGNKGFEAAWARWRWRGCLRNCARMRPVQRRQKRLRGGRNNVAAIEIP